MAVCAAEMEDEGASTLTRACTPLLLVCESLLPALLSDDTENGGEGAALERFCKAQASHELANCIRIIL